MERLLTKAEILWTRKCPLKCGYCAMIDYPQFEQARTELMLEGVRRLHKLGCGFFAIYGSSPLWADEFVGLPEFVREAESLGVLTTIIADGVEKRSRERLEILHDHGLRSLTCSYDGSDLDSSVHVDRHTRLKAGKGIELVRWFKERYDDLRDVELVATITKRNWRHMLVAARELSAEGIWFSFDFVHPNLGHPGTKCKGDAKGLRFEPTEQDHDAIREIGWVLGNLRANGHHVEARGPGGLIHQSKEYLNLLCTEPEVVTHFAWKCSRGKAFPSWVTIDADGSVLPCDDFWTDRSFKVWELDESTLARFGELYRKEVEDKCSGCAWSTHWDAVRIRNDGGSFDQYVHRVAP